MHAFLNALKEDPTELTQEVREKMGVAYKE